MKSKPGSLTTVLPVRGWGLISGERCCCWITEGQRIHQGVSSQFHSSISGQPVPLDAIFSQAAWSDAYRHAFKITNKSCLLSFVAWSYWCVKVLGVLVISGVQDLPVVIPIILTDFWGSQWKHQVGMTELHAHERAAIRSQIRARCPLMAVWAHSYREDSELWCLRGTPTKAAVLYI